MSSVRPTGRCVTPLRRLGRDGRRPESRPGPHPHNRPDRRFRLLTLCRRSPLPPTTSKPHPPPPSALVGASHRRRASAELQVKIPSPEFSLKAILQPRSSSPVHPSPTTPPPATEPLPDTSRRLQAPSRVPRCRLRHPPVTVGQIHQQSVATLEAEIHGTDSKPASVSAQMPMSPLPVPVFPLLSIRSVGLLRHRAASLSNPCSSDPSHR